MSIQGYEILEQTNHYAIQRVGGRAYYFRDCIVRDASGTVYLAAIRDDLLASS
jgi:hypothetical protein